MSRARARSATGQCAPTSSSTPSTLTTSCLIVRRIVGICRALLDTHHPTHDTDKSDIIPKIRVLIYNGDADACVPYLGNEEWTSSLGFSVKEPWRAWMVNNQVGGYVTEYEEDFSFITIKGNTSARFLSSV